MPKTAPVLAHLSADEDLALSGDVQVTCTLTGFKPGEDPDDCTTHDHAHNGTVLISLDHLVYSANTDALVDEIAERVADFEDFADNWTIEYTATGVMPGNVIVLAVTVHPRPRPAVSGRVYA